MTAFTAYAGNPPGALTSALFAPGSGITASSLAINASGPGAVNFYDGSLAALGIGAGLLLTSGTTPGLANTVGWFGQDNGGAGDADIDAVVNTVFQTQSYDATTLSFDFTVADTAASSISIDLVFGSDEFPEWVDQFVDSAVVLVNGVNYALFNHDPNHPLSVVSANLAAGYFQDNGGGAWPIEYDGVSHVLKIVAPINGGGAVNQIKIGIADTGDHIYDSGIFLANFTAGNIPGSGVVIAPPVACTDASDSVTGTAKDEYFDLKGGDDVAYAGAGDDIVVAGGGDDLVYGGSGADQFEGDSGNDSLDGGDGVDTAVLGGNKNDYQIDFTGSGYLVAALAGGAAAADGSDALSSVEIAQFADGAWSLAADGTVAPWSGGGPVDPAANAPGTVFLAGIGAEGQTLTATVSDADGVPAGGVSYDWQVNGVSVGNSGDTFLVGAAEVGQSITVSASYTDLANHAEQLTSASKYIAPSDDGDFAISLLQLAAPQGASVMNPLTTLMANAITLGVSPNEAGFIVKNVLNLAATVDLAHDDPWAALQAAPDDAAALLVEKKAVQVAVMCSLGGDQSGMALTQAILLADSTNTPLDLADTAVIAGLLGLPADNALVQEIWDRNDTIKDAADIAAIDAIWLDLQSGLDVVLSESIATLNVHLNQAPVGSADAVLPSGVADSAYLLDAASLLSGFSDPDGGVLNVAGLVVSAGTAVDNGDGTYTVTPPAGFSGPIEIAYSVLDGQGASVPAQQLLVIAAKPQPPGNQPPGGEVGIAGTFTQGQLLGAVNTLTDADGLGALLYQWFADGVAIAGASGETLLLTEAQVGKSIHVEIAYTDGLGHPEAVSSAASAPVLNVNDAPTGTVNIAGTPTQGQVLSAEHTLADADGLGALSYQWLADGAAIAGATQNSLTLGLAEVGKAISVALGYTDGHGTVETVASAATAAVAGYLAGTAGNDQLNGGAYADQLFGLAGNDALAGKGGDDRLDGGSGADTLQGGAGHDTYVVDNAADKVFETTTSKSKIDAGGVDTVESGVNWTLGAFVENLTLTGGAGLSGTGNALANTLRGNGGGNTLSGLAGNDELDGGAGNDVLVGGAGNDTLRGGDGADVFRFGNTTLNAASNVDWIRDFAVGDVIELDNAVFKKLGAAGPLPTSCFSANDTGSALDGNDYLLFNTVTGVLSYDADGSGKGAAVPFAEVDLVGVAGLSAADFVIV